jgi:lipoprotein-anchoring transpeptidase ErfK/SrfK
MKFLCAATIVAGLAFFAAPALASTTAAPNLTISRGGKIIHTIPIFDKWTDGATLAVGELGTGNTPVIVVGAGPGSEPGIIIFRPDGTIINKFDAFDKSITQGVIVSLDDVNGDGKNEIVAATGPKYGKFVRVFNGYGKLLDDWYPRPQTVSSIISATTIDNDAMSYAVPAPHFTNSKLTVGKQIEVDLTKQRLYAWNNGLLVATYLVSTGTKAYPTIPGNYKILRKVPIMDYIGPGYNLPNTHWNSQFSTRGDFLHEAWWHKKFGQPMSHGCVNMRLLDAKFIYDWAPIGTPVIIHL